MAFIAIHRPIYYFPRLAALPHFTDYSTYELQKRNLISPITAYVDKPKKEQFYVHLGKIVDYVVDYCEDDEHMLLPFETAQNYIAPGVACMVLYIFSAVALVCCLVSFTQISLLIVFPFHRRLSVVQRIHLYNNF